jgi:O-antigen/teichoic acid export membrane protein
MNKTKIFLANLSSGIVFRILSMISIYLAVPFLLKYLNDTNYGVWVTIFGIINTAYFMDLGIALGLKNQVTKAISTNQLYLAKKYISTAYVTITVISLVSFILVFSFIYSFNMQTLFNVKITEKILKNVLYISSFLVLISVVLNIYKSIFMSFQQSAKVEFAMFLYQLLILIQLIALPYFIKESLVAVSLVYGLTNISIALFFSFIFFYKHKELRPSLSLFEKRIVKDIMGSGVQFFIIQMSLIIILSTDNYLITRYISPEETTIYSLINKLFQTFLIASSIIFTPLWALYTSAYQNKDFQWIKNMFKKLNYLFILLVIGLVIMYFSLDWVLKIWLNRSLEYKPLLIILMAVFVLIRVFGDIYMTFLNGVGKIKLQMWLYIFGALINIPLSIYFISYLNLGSAGVILATCISLFGLSIVMPIQSYKILNEK